VLGLLRPTGIAAAFLVVDTRLNPLYSSPRSLFGALVGKILPESDVFGGLAAMRLLAVWNCQLP
jgi:hypothetical protein